MIQNYNPTPNPYSTRFIKPGMLPFRYPDSISRELILERLRESKWMAEIAGPHGSGKSTLVHDLLPELKKEFEIISQVTVRLESSGRLDVVWSSLANLPHTSPGKLIIIDGVERLSRINRWLLARACRTQSVGLLATVHQPNTWLPTIAVLDASKSTFVKIAKQLQRASPRQLDDRELDLAYDVAGKNCREAFMSLYDRYEKIWKNTSPENETGMNGQSKRANQR